MDILSLITGLIPGIAVGFLIALLIKGNSRIKFQEQLMVAGREKAALEEKVAHLGNELDETEAELQAERRARQDLSDRLARAEVEYKNLKQKLEEQKKEVEELQSKFTRDFEMIANKLLKQSSREVTDMQQKNLEDVLKPLREKLGEFEKKVQESYEKGMKDRTDLRTELRMLKELNQRISEEASHLTRALRSDSKKMGNWGELILDRVLEQSGLTKGLEYQTQYTDRNDDGNLIRPDVIVNLPDKKHLIIDSKVSLVAYDRYTNEEDEGEKGTFLKAHIESIRQHVKGLSEKNYLGASNLDTPDFVLLFMPLESAFSLALQNDSELFNFAWERKIVIVSPTTLLATLKTVASLWKHEKQTRNAMEIAQRGGRLFDKFVAFLKDLEQIGNQISVLGKTYEKAHNKLSSGSGNLIRQADMLKDLGVKAEKSLPQNFTEDELPES